jgi:hypothetical protein
MDLPRWNHGSVAVPACPNGLLFVFGGMSGDLEAEKRAQGWYVVHVINLFIIKLNKPI